jgi:hypothetical protein
MIRTLLGGATAVASASLALSGIAAAPVLASGSPVSLVVPQSVAFTVLGYDCGGISEQSYANGFDTATGYPTGDVYLKTTCSAGGKGGHSVTYSAWVSTMWDFTAALVSYAQLSSAPTVDPNFAGFDADGNELYNSPPFAFLSLAPGFVPAPRVAGISPNPAPQGTAVTVTGTGFTKASAVMFGHLQAVSYVVNSDTSLTAVAPTVRSGTVDVTVVNAGGTSEINPADIFTFDKVPRLGTMSPNHGTADGGTRVTITGANFDRATLVSFGGVSAKFTIVTASTIIATSPPGPDSGVSVDVAVTNKHGTSAIGPAASYLYSN